MIKGMKKFLLIVMTMLSSLPCVGQIGESNPTQYAAMETGNSMINSSMNKQTTAMKKTGLLQSSIAAEFTQMKSWEAKYNSYLKTTKGFAEQLKAGCNLYAEGVMALRNLYEIKKACGANPEGIAASVSMNNLYMETVTELIKTYRSIKILSSGISEDDSITTDTQATPVSPIPYENGCVKVTVTIQNKTNKDIKFDGKICFILHGYMPSEDYTGHKSFHGICSGGNYTIPAGGSRTYTVIFKKEDTPTDGLGLPFAGNGHTGSRTANNAYYIANKGFKCENISESTIFQEGGSYTMTIPSDTETWYSGSGGGANNMLNGKQRAEMLWSVNKSLYELNAKLRQIAISISFYNLKDVWNKATQGMVEKTHGQIAKDALDRWKRAKNVSRILR